MFIDVIWRLCDFASSFRNTSIQTGCCKHLHFSQELVYFCVFTLILVVKKRPFFLLCNSALVGKLGHCFISEQIGKLHLSWLSPLPRGPLCLLSFYITFTSHHVAGSCRSSLLTNVCCPFISGCICLHR